MKLLAVVLAISGANTIGALPLLDIPDLVEVDFSYQEASQTTTSSDATFDLSNNAENLVLLDLIDSDIAPKLTDIILQVYQENIFDAEVQFTCRDENDQTLAHLDISVGSNTRCVADVKRRLLRCESEVCVVTCSY